jgi:hypothetical protein
MPELIELLMKDGHRLGATRLAITILPHGSHHLAYVSGVQDQQAPADPFPQEFTHLDRANVRPC